MTNTSLGTDKLDSELDAILICHKVRETNLVEAKAKLYALIDQLLLEARIDELERLYLVYGSKDNPASLDSLFSLGKKGEVSATPIKSRIAELRKVKDD